MSKPLKELGQEIHRINIGNGWDVPERSDWEKRRHDSHKYRIPTKLALVHSEVSEALEEFRNDDREEFEYELADIIIRTLDIAYGLGVDIDARVAAKLKKNEGRGYRHGGKLV